MDGSSLHFAAIGGIASTGFRIVLRQDLYHVACLVLDAASALNQISTLQAALRAGWVQALIFGDGGLQKVILLNVQVLREGDRAGAGVRVVGVILYLHRLALTLGIVGDGQFDGTQHCHGPLSVLIQILPEAVLQETIFHRRWILGHTDPVTEVPDGGWGIAPAAQAAQGRHTGVVPAGNIMLLHQLAQLPF